MRHSVSSSAAPLSHGVRAGYTRISTVAQTLDQQNAALDAGGVTKISANDGIDSSMAAGRMVIGVVARMAEFERELGRERTALKRATSRDNGTQFGRPHKGVFVMKRGSGQLTRSSG